MVAAHVRDLIDQLAALIADRVAAGEFSTNASDVAAPAVLSAIARFHAAAWADPWIDDELQAVCDLLLQGCGVRK